MFYNFDSFIFGINSAKIYLIFFERFFVIVYVYRIISVYIFIGMYYIIFFIYIIIYILNLKVIIFKNGVYIFF